MPDWIIEEGIGETRAALVDGDEILEARVRREGVIAAGAVLDARLVAVAPRVTVEAGGEHFLLPRGVGGVTEGARLAIEIMREAIGGSERWKRGLARRTDAAQRRRLHWRRARQATIARLGRSSRRGAVRHRPVRGRRTSHSVDGGDDRHRCRRLVDPRQARADGRAGPRRARSRGWTSAARSGSISRPLHGKEERREVDEILDAYLPQPFEKTAINGFGFAQIVRPRRRAVVA